MIAVDYNPLNKLDMDFESILLQMNKWIKHKVDEK